MFYFLMSLPFILDLTLVTHKTRKSSYKRIFRLLISAVYVIVACTYYEKYQVELAKETIIERYNTVTVEKEVSRDGVFCTATYYNAVESQCDSDPLITASGDSIDLEKLNRYELRWIAISRDLREYYSFGDSVYIESNNKSVEGWWVVKDLMNRRFRRRIDFLVPEKDTLRVGKCAVKLLFN